MHAYNLNVAVWSLTSQLKTMFTMHSRLLSSTLLALFFKHSNVNWGFPAPFSPLLCSHGSWFQSCFSSLHIFRPPPQLVARRSPSLGERRHLLSKRWPWQHCCSPLSLCCCSSWWKILHRCVGWHNCSSVKCFHTPGRSCTWLWLWPLFIQYNVALSSVFILVGCLCRVLCQCLLACKTLTLLTATEMISSSWFYYCFVICL